MGLKHLSFTIGEQRLVRQEVLEKQYTIHQKNVSFEMEEKAEKINE